METRICLRGAAGYRREFLEKGLGSFGIGRIIYDLVSISESVSVELHDQCKVPVAIEHMYVQFESLAQMRELFARPGLLS